MNNKERMQHFEHKRSSEEASSDRFLTQREASELTGFSASWFQRKRCEGGGPPFVKTDRYIRYRKSVLIAWMESRTVSNTSETPAGDAV